MTRRQRVTRRRFLGTAAATAAGISLPAAVGRGAGASDPQAGWPATDHFWYRPQPAGLFVDSQCDDRAFAYTDGEVLLSEDNGRTWPLFPTRGTSSSVASSRTETCCSAPWLDCTSAPTA